MLIDFTQTMAFCRWKRSRIAFATSAAIQGSEFVPATLRKNEPSSFSTRFSSVPIRGEPGEVVGTPAAIVVGAVAQSDIVGRRGDDDIDGALLHAGERGGAVADHDLLLTDKDRARDGVPPRSYSLGSGQCVVEHGRKSSAPGGAGGSVTDFTRPRTAGIQ